jgi:hypothetical protein
MKKTILNACLVLLMFTLTAGVALATQFGPYTRTIPAGTGTLTYTVSYTVTDCNRSGSLEYSSYYDDFSYKSASGLVTPIAWAFNRGYNSCTGKGNEEAVTYIVLTSAPSTFAKITFTPQNPDTGNAAAVAGVTGWANPKYKIVGIDYTVPGEQSYVQYTNTTMMGTSTSNSSSFSTAVASSIEICGGAGIGSSSDGTSVCGTYSNSFTQESDTSSSFAVSQSTAFTNKWFALDGPQLDHGNDVIYVWVNPQAWYTMFPTGTAGPTPVYWNGYTYDETDDSNNMEVIPLRLTWLLNPSTIPTSLQGRLLRAWAPKNTDGTAPGLTTQDYLKIAAADPFSNPNYVVTIGSDGKTTTDDRFTQTTNGELYYEPGYNDVYNWVYTTTDTEGQGGKNTYVQSFAIEVKNSNDWIADISFDWKESTTFTWIDQWNTLMTQMMSQMNTVSITGPTGTYTGPEEFNVYQDNVYGTFMVNPVPPT